MARFSQLYEAVTEDGVTKNLHYLYAPAGLFAIFAKSANNTEVMIQIAFSRIMLSDN